MSIWKNLIVFYQKNHFLVDAMRVARFVIGGICLVLGVAGVFLPIVPGFIFFAIGLPLVGGGWIVHGAVKLWKRFLILVIGWFV
jgi:hypothetical protein